MCRRTGSPHPEGRPSGWEAALADFVARRALPSPWIGLCTSAWTQYAEVAFEGADGLRVLSLVSVGLGNPIAAGTSPMAAAHGALTINTIVVVDAMPSPAALVNLVITVTEVKTAALREAGLSVLTASRPAGRRPTQS